MTTSELSEQYRKSVLETERLRKELRISELRDREESERAAQSHIDAALKARREEFRAMRETFPDQMNREQVAKMMDIAPEMLKHHIASGFLVSPYGGSFKKSDVLDLLAHMANARPSYVPGDNRPGEGYEQLEERQGAL